MFVRERVHACNEEKATTAQICSCSVALGRNGQDQQSDGHNSRLHHAHDDSIDDMSTHVCPNAVMQLAL